MDMVSYQLLLCLDVIHLCPLRIQVLLNVLSRCLTSEHLRSRPWLVLFFKCLVRNCGEEKSKDGSKKDEASLP